MKNPLAVATGHNLCQAAWGSSLMSTVPAKLLPGSVLCLELHVDCKAAKNTLLVRGVYYQQLIRVTETRRLVDGFPGGSNKEAYKYRLALWSDNSAKQSSIGCKPYILLSPGIALED